MTIRSALRMLMCLFTWNAAAVEAAAGRSGWEFLLDWGNFGEVEDIAVDSEGVVFVLDRPNGVVQAFTAKGEYLREQGGFNDPTGLAIDEGDTVYVQEKCRIHRFTTNFKPLGSWDSCIGKGDLQANRSLDVRNGVVWVVTTNDVLKFTPNGISLGRFMGDVGGNAVHIVPDGSIWVATGYGSLGLVRHYAVSGQVLIEWNTVLPGEQSSIPFDIAVDSAERVFIADGRVKIFTANGTLEDLIEPPLSVLTGIELASDEILYAAKTFTSPGRVQKYRRIPTSVESGTWGNIKSRYR